MPQRLIKTSGQAGQALQVNGRALVSAHEQIVSILRSRLGQNHGDLLAAPKLEPDGSITWSTGVAGAAVPASELPDEERTRVQQRAERIVGEIRGLAEQLRGEGPAAQMVAQMLDHAVQTPPGEWLYSVGGKPVLAMWGHSAVGAPQPAPLQAAVAAPMAATTATTAATAAAAVAAPTAGATAPGAAAIEALGAGGVGGSTDAGPPVPPPEQPRKSSMPWLVGGLLGLVLLALLLWGLQRYSDMPRADAALAAQIAQADARNRALEQEIASKSGQPAPSLRCVMDTPPPAPPAAVASAPEPPASAALPEPPPSAPARSPLDVLKQRVAGADCNTLQQMLGREPLLKGSDPKALALKQEIVATMAKNCREKLIQEAKNLCPDQRPKELAPEMVIVFDASGSMNFSLNATEQEIEQAGAAEAVQNMMRQFGLGPRGGGNSALDRLTREPRRITVAKQATAAVVQRTPSDMNMGLVMVDQCPSARSVGMFGPAQRGALLGQVQAIQPRAGTPLADGIAKGGQMVDGVKREAVMLVISDGVESCGQDPCAVAAALARAKPHLKINIVDITGTGAGNCVARATHGQVFTARNADEVVAMTNRATQEAMGPASCRKQ